ncbi:hypothetical protein [Arthrobacter rhizosphaerae]|uniref:hypothetical protein n=1 Tax=Arthrobacter rhizosphaerae TaxID=2855490 RepID=UPI001FF4523C|nr:hypothetical protein [Arthrobacter rhizosphaerae]
MKRLRLSKAAGMAAAGALLLTLLPATAAMAAEGPTTEELLAACEGADHCEFVPVSSERYTTDVKLVSPMSPNCGPGVVDLQSNWTETTGSSDTVGGSITAKSGVLFGLFEASIEANYNHQWSRSDSKGGFVMVHVPALSIGYVTKSTAMERVKGYYKMNFSERRWDHYYWTTSTVTVEGPDKNGIGNEIVQGHTRPMTNEELALHCPN